MVRKFKKPSGIIIKTDSNVHSKEYIAHCAKSFDKGASKVQPYNGTNYMGV